MGKLHHIGIASSEPGWWRSLGYEPVSAIYDRAQGVHVTVFRSPNSSVLIERVEPDGPESPAYNMKGIYHLCFESNTIPEGWTIVSRGRAAAFDNRPTTWCFKDGQLVEFLHDPT